METVIQVQGLTKKFGSRVAVDNIDFEVMRGQIFGLLGPNGSGKTTTLSTLLTLLEPGSGILKLFGSDDRVSALSRIGVLLESANYYHDLTAYENLRITCLVKSVGFEKIDEMLERLGLLEDKKRKVKQFSLGMKQRLALAAALLSDPELLILDEPTNGLDPVGIAEVRGVIQDLAAKGKTVLVASHLLNEMEKVCTHIAVLKKGKVLAKGELKSVTQGYNTLEDFFLAKTK